MFVFFVFFSSERNVTRPVCHRHKTSLLVRMFFILLLLLFFSQINKRKDECFKYLEPFLKYDLFSNCFFSVKWSRPKRFGNIPGSYVTQKTSYLNDHLHRVHYIHFQDSFVNIFWTFGGNSLTSFDGLSDLFYISPQKYKDHTLVFAPNFHDLNIKYS